MRVRVVMGAFGYSLVLWMGMTVSVIVGVIVGVTIGPGGEGLAVKGHTELRGRYAGPRDFVGVHRIAIDREAAERAPEVVERESGIDESPEHHVARDTGEAIEVNDRAHGLALLSYSVL
jgi:hypothetical protein